MATAAPLRVRPRRPRTDAIVTPGPVAVKVRLAVEALVLGADERVLVGRDHHGTGVADRVGVRRLRCGLRVAEAVWVGPLVWVAAPVRMVALRRGVVAEREGGPVAGHGTQFCFAIF